MKSILFITSTNLASNPRLAKELQLAANNGYKTSVVQFYFENWSDYFTSELEKRLPDTSFYNLSAGRKPFFPWFLGSVLSRLFRIIPKMLQTPFTISIITGKRSLSLLKWVRAHKKNYTIVIAHNPPSFYPAYILSKKTGAKLGIDIEDYHPGETCIQKEQWYMGLLMKFTLPFADYCSYAATLIAQQVNEDIPSLSGKQLVVPNVFPSSEFVKPESNQTDTLRMVWYSQNIDQGRGLEEVILAVNEIYPKVELHLIGQIKKDFKEYLSKNDRGIFLHDSLPQEELHKYLSHFDIGIATDLPINKNREMAVTNKLITYAQAGLYILAFYSRGQIEFLNEHKLLHQVMNDHTEDIKRVIRSIQLDQLENIKNKQYHLAGRLDWLNISTPLLYEWNKLSA